MKEILIIQSRSRPMMIAAEQAEYGRTVAGAANLSFISSLDHTAPWHHPREILANYDGVILGGSGEFDFDGGREQGDEARSTSLAIAERMRPFVEYVLENDFPLLGICFGHQIVAEVLGTKVVNDKTQDKVGTYPIARNDASDNDRLFSALPRTFLAQYAHKDSLSSIPSGAVVLAAGEHCRTSALRYGQKVYTVQFHPELTAEDFVNRLNNSPGYLPEGVIVEQLVKSSPASSTIIPRFIREIS